MKAMKGALLAMLGALCIICLRQETAYASAGVGNVIGETVVNVADAANKTPSTGAVQNSVSATAAGEGTGASGSSSETQTLKQIKEAAKKEISDYGKIKKAGTSKDVSEKIDKAVKKYTDLIGTAKGNDNIKGLNSQSSIKDCIATAKETIDDLLEENDDTQSGPAAGESAQPTSTSDFIMVGGNWVVPVVSYGQRVNIVLPVVNMSSTPLYNVTVTPVVSNTTSEWPFVLETSNYTQTIPDLPGKGNGQDDMDRRRELTWNFAARDDALSGYYKLQFNVLYSNSDETESCTLTTYVKVIGAPGSGNIETEGGSISTPRVIVTGYSTNPEKVHAGDDFTLTIHIKNTSKRTAVSNMLVTFTAPNEGDADSGYAAFLPVSGSNSEYISYIGRQGETDLVIDMSSKPDLAQKPYQLDLSMEYEDEEYTAYTATADITIPVEQDERFEINTPDIMPSEINVGGEADVMFSIYNLGKVPLYNVKVSFDKGGVDRGETFIGKIEAGGTGNVDAMVSGQSATKEGEKPEVVISYEDEAGNRKEYREEIDLKVLGDAPQEGVEGEYPVFDIEDEYEEDELEDQEGLPLIVKVIIAVALAVVFLIIVSVVIAGRRRKKREADDLKLLSELTKEAESEAEESLVSQPKGTEQEEVKPDEKP